MILLTGATGLVGGNLLWYLLQENERVSAIRRHTSKMEPLEIIFSFYTSNPSAYLNRIDWIIADVLDERSLLNALTGIEIVYHCAAVVSLENNSDLLTDTNILGTRNIVNAALKQNIQKFCFVSSIAACGKEKNNNEIDESIIWEDQPHRSQYARSKYYSEQEVWKGIEKGLKAIIVNPGVILGVSGTNNGSSRLFTQVQKGMMFYTNGGSGYVDVRDVVRAMIILTNSKITAERFILVAENCSNKEVLCWIADGFGKTHPRISIGKRLFFVIGCIFEIIGKLFHITPLINRGIARTATHRDYYTNAKIKKTIGFEFTPIKKCIAEICLFTK